jgi:hypothetical protein
LIIINNVGLGYIGYGFGAREDLKYNSGEVSKEGG